MARKKGRTQACGIPQARQRFAQAPAHLEVAELAGDTSDPDLEYAGVAASIAILAGIAAADAACCAALGCRSRSDNHHDAADLLAEIGPAFFQARHEGPNFHTISGIETCLQLLLVKSKSADLRFSPGVVLPNKLPH